MKEELQDDLKVRDDYILNRVITWNTCWMIFEPGTIVFTADDKEDRALRLKSGSYVSTQCGPAFALDCDYVDWDGEHFGLGGSRKLIHEFAGTKPITKLTAFPLKYHENLAEVKKTLTERGERFEALSGYRYQHYQGVAVGQGAWGPVKYNVCRLPARSRSLTQQQQVDSRIILDTYAWNRCNPNRQISLGPLNQAVGQDNDGDDAEDRSEDEYGDASLDALLAQGTHQLGQARSQSLTKDQLLLCSATLKGYSLKNKKWRQYLPGFGNRSSHLNVVFAVTFSISSVGEIKWNDSAFESLVLPTDHKELILALTESQVANKDSFDDVIQGKGIALTTFSLSSVTIVKSSSFIYFTIQCRCVNLR